MSEVAVQLNSQGIAQGEDVSVCAIILCSYASGKSIVRNISLNGDVLTATRCMIRLGANIELDGNTAHIIGAPFRSCAIDCGKSEITAQLLIGLLAGLNGVFEVTGDSSIYGSVKKVIEPLKLMGARISDCGGHFPVRIVGSPLGGMEYFMPTAGVKGALLMAGLNSSQTVIVAEKTKTCDYIERLLKLLNGEVAVNGNTVRVGASVLFGNDINVSRRELRV